MKKLLLLGAYGQDNLGDELLLKTFLDLFQDYRITANSSSADATADKFNIPVFPTDGSKFTLLKHLLQSSVVVVGGGSQFKELPAVFGRNKNGVLFSLLLIACICRITFKKFYCISVGAGPLDGRASRLLTRVIIRLSSAVILRDSGSLELIRSITKSEKVHLGADALFFAADSVRKQIKNVHREEKSVLMVPNLHTRSEDLAGYQTGAYAALCEYLLAEGFTIRFLPFQSSFTEHNDLVAAKTIISRVKGLDESAILSISSDTDVYTVFAQHTLVVGVRLHSLIIAALTGTPMMALSYDPKVTGFMNDIGMAGYNFELTDMPAHKTLRDELLSLYNKRAEAHARITAAVTDLSARNRLAFDSLTV
ncbi:MAG: colanic acid biosynthesis protein [candidate division WS6 bacterium OLB20]|uniref:Colanic acid biosynthesis protein n=1 Tax=candidate division WS6 bacterium OLB20 TaxID=1617426 RepID=A0A136LZG6_9BACT|nr:MAG: colanic acid biosynthesis protein [candidate division WS6 bacterium OLB20]